MFNHCIGDDNIIDIVALFLPKHLCCILVLLTKNFLRLWVISTHLILLVRLLFIFGAVNLISPRIAHWFIRGFVHHIFVDKI